MPLAATPTAPPSDAVRSLAWTAAIERVSDSLPRARGVARYRRRDYLHDNRVAVAAAFDATGGLPGSGVFVNPATGASLLVAADSQPPVRTAAAVDVVVAGAMRTAEQLRFRSFYLTAGAARSLVVHQRSAAAVPTPLVAGSRLQTTLTGCTPFVVPRILETGLHRRENADWVVEEALDGAPVVRADAEAAAGELIALLPQMWRRLGTSHDRLDPDQRARALVAFAGLAEDPPDGIWPAEVDRQATWHRVRDLLNDERPLTVGLSHGDPGLGNVLRLADGRLALVDWEDAGHRVVAHDIVKVLMSSPDPVRLAATLDAPGSLRPALAVAGAMPWRRQLATALLLFLSGWRNRHFRAVKRRSVVASQRRMHAMIRVLTVLLD